MTYEERRSKLLDDLASLPAVAVAFSGGVDSSVLSHAAHAALADRAVAVIADSPSLPRRELEEANRLAAAIGIRLEVVGTDEMEDERYVANAGDRCYFCKQALFVAMKRVAAREGIEALAFGRITDDASDDRPGERAASEAGVLAPLADAGFNKLDVRRYAREVGLDVADKPASACLASRLPVGTTVTAARLSRVERAEAALQDFGLRVLRVRDHGEMARLEVGASESEWATSKSAEVGGLLFDAGFPLWELAVYRPPESSRADSTGG